jgi:hypothetical protein
MGSVTAELRARSARAHSRRLCGGGVGAGGGRPLPLEGVRGYNPRQIFEI